LSLNHQQDLHRLPVQGLPHSIHRLVYLSCLSNVMTNQSSLPFLLLGCKVKCMPRYLTYQ
jgi:hypothetical protein